MDSDSKTGQNQPAQSAKLDVVINRRSGTVLRLGEEKVAAGLREAFGDRAGDITFIDGRDIASTVQGWAQVHAGTGRGIIIGGGDGTVLTAAEEILGRPDIVFGVLPLGTHNLFARQLGYAADFNEAALQYRTSRAQKVDVGLVNGMHFLCGIVLDENSVHFYQAREDFRDKKRVSALRHIFASAAGALLHRSWKLDVAGRRHNGKVFTVTKNVLAPKPNRLSDLTPRNLKAVIENILAPAEGGDGKLAFYAVSGKPWKLLSLPRRLLNGTWTQSRAVTSEVAAELLIAPVNVKDAGKETTIIVDGEIKKTSYPLDVKILPGALSVFRPQ